MGKVREWTRTKQYKNIHSDLIDQLERDGIIGQQFFDMVDEYMNYWVIAQDLKEDIKKNGAVVTYQNGEHQKGTKKNPAFDMLKSVNNTMFKILSFLKIKPNPDVYDETEDEDDRL